MTIPKSHARSTRGRHPSRIYRWELHYPQKSSCPPKSLSNPASSTPYFHASSLPPFLTPSPHQTPQSCSLSPAHSLRVQESWHELHVAEQDRHHKPLPFPKPSSHPSAALQSSFPGAHAEESELINLTQEKPHMYSKIRPCTEQFPQSN